MSVLLEPATDWTNQELHQRLKSAAEALYVHGYLTRAEYGRVQNELTTATAAALSVESGLARISSAAAK